MAAAPIQICPPSDYYRFEKPHFDQHQFQKLRGRPPRLGPNSEDTLGRGEFGGLHIERHKVTQERRLAAPEWVNNEALLRETVVHFLERRAFHKSEPKPGTYQERIDRAEQAMAARIPKMRERIRKWIAEYKSSLDSGQPDDKRLRDLEVEIKNTDRQICVIRKGMASILLSVVYLYYRSGWDATTVAEELGLTSMGVHQIIFQMLRLAAGRKRQETQKCCVHGHRLTLRNLRANGQCKVCKNAIEKRYRQRHRAKT
jgi:hypothetical protein